MTGRSVNLILACVLPLLTVSCGYNVGPTFPEEVRTVAVPMFKNETYRRDIEIQLTEAVQAEIKQRTHFVLAKEPNADTRLSGRIISINKRVLGETGFDDPRELQYSLAIKITWEDLRTGRILREEQINIDPDQVPLIGRSEFAPEIGQSRATAEQTTVKRLAQQVVDRMEFAW